MDKTRDSVADIDRELLVSRERENDGNHVYLYHSERLGLYLGYGLSAYYTTAVLDPETSYSEELDMPVVMLRRDDILRLRQSMTVAEHEAQRYYHLRTRGTIGRRWYGLWKESVIRTWRGARRG